MNGNFYGWYFKCQSDTQTLAVIPALHKGCCSIQFITDDGVWNAAYKKNAFYRAGKQIKVAKNYFSEKGMSLSVDKKGLLVNGNIRFGKMTPLKYDIMGPFSVVPFMECRHSVWSMQHSVWGNVCINGKDYSFQGDCGYWEGDSGTSFPREYAWTQCFFKQGSLMLSVAEIPLAKMTFTGVIGVVYWKGKEYRFATYLGARVIQKHNKKLWIRQGTYELEAWLIEQHAHPLKAPVNGKMSRTIHESAACRAYYCFRKDGKVLFSFESERASFEYCMEGNPL
uniref:hypothetical protein n=1 Tax=Agathobacter sp. TaxID=2021311 RepID=UPI004055E8C4